MGHDLHRMRHNADRMPMRIQLYFLLYPSTSAKVILQLTL